MKANLTFVLLPVLAMSLTHAAPTPPKNDHRHDGMNVISKLNSSDAVFLKKAMAIHLAAIKLGEYASANASDAKVKEFGSMMVKEHEQGLADLRLLAIAKNHRLPKRLDMDHQNLWNELSDLQGTSFDARFKEEMLTGHQKALLLFERAAQFGEDAEVRKYAKKYIPAIKEHLDTLKTHSRVDDVLCLL